MMTRGHRQRPNGKPSSGPIFHQVRTVRLREGVSLRAISKRTGVAPRELKQQECGVSDLRLSDLRLWRDALDVPLIELIVDDQSTLSQSVRDRARLVKVMKTVRALQNTPLSVQQRRLLEMLEGQLQELMPELEEIHAWPSVGHRRASEDLGRVIERSVADEFFDQNEEPD